MENFAIQYVWLIPLLPLIGAAIAGFFGARHLRGASHWPIWLTVGGSAVLSIMLLVALLDPANTGRDGLVYITKTVFTWISAGDPATAMVGGASDYLNVKVGYLLDPLSAVMLCVVCGIGFLITVFAAGYMKGESGYWRFFAYLGLFIFMMTNLVMGENLLMLYLGWEGVGLCSYLLIGYYYEKPSARDAATKAFIVNRIGDFGFALGIMLCFAAFGTVSYLGDGVATNTGLLEMFVTPFDQLNSTQQMAVQWVPFLLMIGAFGKSAQFPLYVWLPDAMEGPTPVSALIHAATMVTAGVYMIARCGTMFFHNMPGGAFDAPLWTIAIVGAFTALLAATIAMRQFDLKKVFAYSTVSQLGYMFVAVAVLAPVAAVFHLVTHAFFKALLFLGSGVVMHAMDGELDMRKMSGLKSVLPKTRWLMLAGCAALAGFPIVTSGFYSKDEIVAAAWHHNAILAGVLLLTSFLTAYYTFRLYFRVFHGPVVLPSHPAVDTIPSEAEAGDAPGHLAEGHSGSVADNQHGPHGGQAGQPHGHGHHNHEPWLMIAPLVILAIGSLIVGPLLYFVKSNEAGVPKENQQSILSNFLGKSPSFNIAYTEANLAFPNASNVAFGVVRDRGGLLVERDASEVADENQMHLYMMIGSGVLALAGIGIAYLLHKKDRRQADALADKFRGIATVLDRKYWVDEIYDAAIVRPLWAVGQWYEKFDRWVIDGLVWAVSFAPQVAGFSLKLTLQRGYLQGYAAGMVFGVVVILVAIFVL
ncbi:MAG TPA: NADH-quinone oxidoreductase subunit L [Tepidisphaeraceae bacterium]|jgi:NADH-quinone oxidoreductase subunit L|nr:NADH-quinone oxidoreductase subunit L [Tepidisphaeraceae bacterium]